MIIIIIECKLMEEKKPEKNPMSEEKKIPKVQTFPGCDNKSIWIKSVRGSQVIRGNISVPRWAIAPSDLPEQPETTLRKWDFVLSSWLTSAVSSERKQINQSVFALRGE